MVEASVSQESPAPAAPSRATAFTIQEGSKVILEMNDDRHIFVVVRGRKCVGADDRDGAREALAWMEGFT